MLMIARHGVERHLAAVLAAVLAEAQASTAARYRGSCPYLTSGIVLNTCTKGRIIRTTPTVSLTPSTQKALMRPATIAGLTSPFFRAPVADVDEDSDKRSIT